MGFSDWLIHTCTIQVDSGTQSTTGYVPESWANQSTSVKCRFVARLERFASESLGMQMLTVFKMFFPTGTTISTEHQITDITLTSSGVVVDAGPYQVQEVLPRNRKTEHHITCLLEKVE